MKKKLLIIFMLLSCTVAWTQDSDFLIKKEGDQGRTPKYITISQVNPIKLNDPSTFLTKLYQLDSKCKGKEIAVRRGPDNLEHHRIQQYVNGRRVIGCQAIIHNNQNTVVSVSSNWVADVSNFAESPKMDAQQLIEVIANDLDVLVESVLDIKDNSRAPIEELIYVQNQKDKLSSNFRLAYLYKVYIENPYKMVYYYIDALNGQILLIEDRIHKCNTPATGESIYSGTVNFSTDNQGDFRLFDCLVHTRDGNNASNPIQVQAIATEITDVDVFWAAADHLNDQAGIDVQWGMNTAFQFGLTTFGLNSVDGAGHLLNSYINYGTNWNNAAWVPDDEIWIFGEGNGNGPLVTLDIVGHEYWHGVTTFSADLIYDGESGAINESLSDIYGTAIESFGGNGLDWLIGDELSGGGFRDMSNPNAFGQPDCYLGLFYQNGADVHINSGVMNHWFYLLTVGGSGINDAGDSYTVDGLGIDDALNILYLAQMAHMTPSDGFADARNWTLQAAEDLFGACSQEYASVANAWYAVCVGNEFMGRDEPTNLFTSPVTVCKATLNWDDMLADYYIVCYNKVGELEVCNLTNEPYFDLSFLEAGADYEWRVQGSCGGQLSDWSNSTFSTPEECPTPEALTISEITTCSALISWADIGYIYSVSYAPCDGSSGPINVSTITNSILLSGLEDDKCYEIGVATDCHDCKMLNSASIGFQFSTTSCDGSPITNITASACRIFLTMDYVADASYRVEWKKVTDLVWTVEGDFGFLYPYSSPTINVQPGMMYEVRIVTLCLGDGCQTESVSPIEVITTPALDEACEPPSNVDVDIWFNGSLVQVEAGPSASATSFQIQWRYDPGDNFTGPYDMEGTSYALGGGINDCYLEVQVRSICGCMNPQQTSNWETVIFDADDFECANLETFFEIVYCNNNTKLYTDVRLCTEVYEFRLRQTAPNSSAWDTNTESSRSSLYAGLDDCATYVWQARLICADGTAYTWAPLQTFDTPCCEDPENFMENVVDDNSAEVSWDAVDDAEYYEVQWREVGSSTWMGPFTVTDLSAIISPLMDGSIYEWCVRSVCFTHPSCPMFSEWVCSTFTFLVPGNLHKCEAPINLDCTTIWDNNQQIATLFWDVVPAAFDDGYEVQITTNICCNAGDGFYFLPVQALQNYYEFTIPTGITCFSWRVRSICHKATGLKSPWSVSICYNVPDAQCSPILRHYKMESNQFENENKVKLGTELNPEVFPNPNFGHDFTFKLKAPRNLNIAVEIYDINGKLIKLFEEENYPNGLYNKSWSFNESINDGLYLVLFKTNFGTFQKKVVISKGDVKQR